MSPAAVPLRQVQARPTDGATPSLMLDDEVYFQHPEHGPVSGKVVTIGKDGFRALLMSGDECEVTWDCLLGHKVRAARHMAIVESGEDGHIAVDHHGQRVYIRGPLGPTDPDVDAGLVKAARGQTTPLEVLTTAPVDLAPLADALATFAKSLGTHLARTAEREEAADIRREALDAELLKAQAQIAGSFRDALGEVLKAHTAEFARLHTDVATLHGLVSAMTLKQEAALVTTDTA